MITKEDIFRATNGGLDVILYLYPQAAECVGSRTKKFCLRNERTASSNIRQVENKYGKVWQVTDFGDDAKGRDCIECWKRDRGVDFPEAILQIAAQWNIVDELNHAVNKPDIRQRAAESSEQDGSRQWKVKEKFTADELRVMGPNVTQETVDSLHWYSLEWITNVKERRVTEKSSNAHYPIFARQCVIKEASGDQPEESFYKVYEPLNTDKGFRFSYMPAGKKPQKYINGLAELKAAYRQFNAAEEAEWRKIHGDEGAPYREKKLPEAFVCSGERDSLCCRSHGYHPLWFNSETYDLSGEEYKEIMKYVEVLYNIPDIDETGRRKGRELALKFIDIHTIWLPSWLSTYKDHRGKSRKDLRDWMELRPARKDFKNLMKSAMPARFWTSYTTKDGKVKHEIDTACLFNFLQLNGFFSLRDDNSQSVQFVRIQGNIVKRVTAKDMRSFVLQWLDERYEDRDIVNLVLNSMRLSNVTLENIKEVDLNFTSYTPSTQLFFFPNKTVEVRKNPSKGGRHIEEYEPGADGLHNFVWEENVIPHRFKLMEDFFTIKHTVDDEGKDYFDIDIHNVRSHFFGYLINTSRLYWRKELEYNFEDNETAAKEYAAANRFRIDGEGLSPIEIHEQKINLINKIFSFGYMLHHYKAPSRAWAPMAMDNKIGEANECNGRSGKSFFFKTLSYLMKTVKLSGRNPKLMDNPHVFDQVTQHTQMLLLDDCDRYLNTGLFYDNITSDMTVNPKNNKSFSIPFEDSPKIAFTTNYVPSDFDPSSEARLLYMVFSDYYHQKTKDNDYKETRSIRDDFDKDLYGKSYSEDEWLADLNFWLQCCRFYLSLADRQIKITPPMRNIITRKLKADMGDNFEDWANGYFDPDSGHLDTLLPRDQVLENYMQYAKISKITMQSFVRKIKAFVTLCPWIKELDPEEHRNTSGRIIRKVKLSPDRETAKEMFYFKSVQSATADDKKTATESVLPF